MTKKKPIGPWLCAVLITCVLMLFAGPEAEAGHDSGRECSDCHALLGSKSQPGTHLIAIPAMQESLTHGWTPARKGVGCTFCHRSVTATPAMPDALTPFTGTTPNTSRHPVSRNFTNNTIDNTAYLSNDNTTTAGHLDCKDCHDLNLTSYPNHDKNWLANIGVAGQTKASNPYGLKSVTQPKGYDVLCRTCHLSAAAFTAFTGKAISTATSPKLLLATHDNAANDNTNAIRDLDNTFLKPQIQRANNRTCSMCHDGHNSSRAHLYSDGHEKDWNGVAETPIDEVTDCTTVCHMRGDALNSYDSHGHGKNTNWNGVPLNRACTACHEAAKPHTAAPANYEAKYRLPDLPAAAKDNSVFGKAVKSICIQCHGDKRPHILSRTINGSNQVGCLDCHDQHAKSSDNNVMMIRNTNRVAGTLIGIATDNGSTIGSESVLFRKSPRYPSGDPPGSFPADNVWNFYTNVSYGTRDPLNAGFCDQRACHGAGTNGGVSFIPMDNYIRLSGKHSGDTQSPNSNCEACHKHDDPAGSFRAVSSCTSCHGAPPPPADSSPGVPYPRNEIASPHLLHGNSFTNGGYEIACRKCHNQYTDSAYHNTVSTGKTFQSVFFDPTLTRGAPLPYDNATYACSNITCHSDGRGGNPFDNAIWFTGVGGQVTLGCTSCHRGSTATARPMISGAHPKHLAEGQTCSTCHVNSVGDDNVTLLDRPSHVDFIRNVSIKAAYDNNGAASNWDNATLTCSGISCHGGNPVNWVTDIGKISCANCHAATTGDVDDFGTGSAASIFNNSITSVIDNTEWNYSGHGRDTLTYDCTANPAANLLGSSTGRNKCKFCHDGAIGHDNVSNPFRLANINVPAATGWNGNCLVCHFTGQTGYQPPPDNATLTYNNKPASKKVDTAHWNWTGANLVNSRHTGIYNGGKFCWDCHDPHGDRRNNTTGNIVMIGKKVSAQTDNVLGIPDGGTSGAGRRDAVFTRNLTGPDYATGSGSYLGICETCHIAASGITHYFRTGPGTAHFTTNCIECHSHNDNFKGTGGSNQEQFFDGGYRGDNTSNYRDLSGHRILSGVNAAGMSYPTETNCYVCHGVTGTGQFANECLKCHWENRIVGGTPSHPNGLFEWANPASPASRSAAYDNGAVDNTTGDAMCLQCHGTGGGTQLNGVNAPVIIPVGEGGWTAANASGHGAAATLSGGIAGPPAYHCADCHKSTAFQTGGGARDQNSGGFHGSINRKLVRHDNVTAGGQEYPHPSDLFYNLVGPRSARMDSYCAGKCHGVSGGQAKDDGVVDHAWDLLGGQSKTGIQTHPSNMTSAAGLFFRTPDNIPLSEYQTGALPGTGNEVCITCHNPHGGGVVGTRTGTIGSTLINNVGGGLTGGAKQMLRRSFSDNASTICKECHL